MVKESNHLDAYIFLSIFKSVSFGSGHLLLLSPFIHSLVKYWEETFTPHSSIVVCSDFFIVTIQASLPPVPPSPFAPKEEE